MNTTLKKRDKGGWEAETIIDFMGDRKLSIITYKSGMGEGLVSSASVNKYTEFSVVHAYGLSSGGDYGKRLIRAPGRATEKSILAQHQQALALVPDLLDEARTHYAKYPPRD